MNVLLDILGATIVGGIVFTLFLNLNMYSSQARYSSNTELQLMQNAKTLAEMLTYDLRKIGFKHKGQSLITTQSKRISFYTDIDTNGVDDVVGYALSSASEVPQTSNPNDKILERVVNGDTAKGPSLGITDLKFHYLNAKQQPTAVLDSIKYIKAEIWVQSPEPVNDKYIFTYWEMTINPRNL